MAVLCGCMGVTKDDVIEAIENGAKSFEEVQEATQISTGCGACRENNEALVAELLTARV